MNRCESQGESRNASSSRRASVSGKRCNDQQLKEQSSSPTPKSKANNDVQTSNSRRESPAKRIRIPCKFGATSKNPSCNCWHPPVCHHHKTESGCKYGKKCRFRHDDDEEAPSKKSKKESAEGSVASLKEEVQIGCVSQDSDPQKSILRKLGELRLNASAGHTVKFSGSTWHRIKIRERKGPSRGIIPKCEPHKPYFT